MNSNELLTYEILRKIDLIKFVFFSQFFNYLYLAIKLSILFPLWNENQDCYYLLLILIIDILVLFVNVLESVNLYFGDYKSLANYNHQFLHLQYSKQDYQNYFNLFIAVQNKYFIFNNFLSLAYLVTHIYGIIILIGFDQAHLKIIVPLMVISFVNLLFKLLLIFNRNEGQQRILPKQIQYKKQNQDTCIICLIQFNDGEYIEELICQGKHIFHGECIQQWFTYHKVCPICKCMF